MLEAGLYDLISAFKELLDRRKALIAHEVEGEGPPVEQRMDELLAMIKEGESLEFLALFAALETKAEMIVTFLALLELIRLKRVRVYQRGMFGPIRVFRPVGPPAEGTPLARVAKRGKSWTRRTKRRRRNGGRARSASAGAEGSALEAYVPGPPVSEPDDVGEVPAVEDAREEPAAPPEAEEGSVLPLPAGAGRHRGARVCLAQPITPKEIARVLQGVPREVWQAQLAELQADYGRDERGLQIVEIAGGFQVTTRPEYNDWVRELLDPRTPTRLSIQALETLAVIAYKQPVTLPRSSSCAA